MPPETELIKQQMSQTRSALVDKLETLEARVFGSAASTSDTVSQTVHELSATVRETTQDVRTTLQEAMSSLRDALDVSRQMHQHPWVLLGGSVIAGYVGGVMLDNLERGHLPSLPAAPAAEQLLPRQSEVRQRIETEPPTRRGGSTFFKALAESFAPELDKLKRAALSMALGAMRDKVSEAVPPQMRDNFTEMMDRVTVKLGGEPTPPGAMLGRDNDHEESNGARTTRAMGRG